MAGGQDESPFWDTTLLFLETVGFSSRSNTRKALILIYRTNWNHRPLDIAVFGSGRIVESMTDQREPFETIYPKAYGWTLDNEGYLAGLVSGDMGYEATDRKLEDLWVDAQVAEDISNRRTGERMWPVHNAMMALVRSFAKTLYPAIKTEFYEGVVVSKKPDASGPYVMGEILYTYRNRTALQLIIKSFAHDKLQVVWASDFELFVPE